MTDSDGFITLGDGIDQVRKTIKSIGSLSKGQALYSQLEQVKSIPSLQSDKLRRTASRLSRKILRGINADTYDIPDANPVEISLALISKVVNAHGIDSTQIPLLLEDIANNNNNRLSAELNTLLLESSHE